MKIIGKAATINVRKVLWTCAELGVHVVCEEPRDLSSPEFRRLNPNALVPVLIDGDFVLWESNSLCRYRGAGFARAPLDGCTDGQARAARHRSLVRAP